MHPDYRAKVQNFLIKSNALTPATTYWLGLHGSTLSTATLPTTATEVARANGYARMPITTGMLSSATTVLSTVHLTTRVQFPDPLTNWTTVKGFAIYDSSVTSGGSASTCVWFGDLNTSVSVTAGNPVSVSSGVTTNGLQIGLS